MRNDTLKKSFIMIFILTFLLSIIGINRVFASEEVFILENASIISKSDETEASISSFNDTVLNTDIIFHKIDDYVSYNLVIKNTTDKEYKINLISDDNDNNNIKYEYSYNNDTIGPNGTTEVVLKATYKNGNTDISNREQDDPFCLILTIEDEDGNTVIDNIIVNPKTGDNITIYVIILLISTTGLLIIIKNKKLRKFFVITLLLTPAITKASAPSFIINLNPTLKLYDKIVVHRIINGEEVEEIIDYGSNIEKPENPSIEGYNFDGWLLNGEEFNFDRAIEEDSVLEAKFSLINYQIEYDLDGGDANNKESYNIETDTFTLVAPSKEGYIFDGWTGSNIEGKQETVTIEKGSVGNKSFKAHWLKSVSLANIDPESIEIIKGKTQEITVTNVDEDYTIVSNDENVATINNNVVTGVKEGTTTLTITGSKSKKTKTINVTINSGYIVKFNSNGGSNVDQVIRDENEKIGELPKPTKTDYYFAGWYEEENFQTRVTTDKEITKNTTFYAKWSPYLCTIATTLHKETCQSGGYCISDGHSSGDELYFGTKPKSSTLIGGFAYDCDVNADGFFDPDTERFYYLDTTSGGNAVLIYYSNYEGTDGIKNENIISYDNSTQYLPTTEQWPNAEVTFDNYAARLATVSEIKHACGKDDVSNNGSLASCSYLMENTKYSSSSLGRSAIWLEKEGSTINRIHSQTRNVANNGNESGVRPVIEIPISILEPYVSDGSEHTVIFDSQGGGSFIPIIVGDKETISNLPVPSKDENTFEGWFTDTTYTTKVTNETPIEEDMTLVAKWYEHEIKINNKTYKTLSDAVKAVPNTEEETTLIVLRDIDVESKISISSKKNIKLDIGSYTINTENDTIFENSGKLLITNGTITSSAANSAIDNKSSGTLRVTGGRIIATGKRQAIYNAGGIVEISGEAYLESASTERATVQNTNTTTGSVRITGGTIVSLNQQAVKNESTKENTLIIGTIDNSFNKTTPVLQGKTYGLTTSSNISMYDGILKGEEEAIDNESKIKTVEENAVIEKSTDGDYKTLTYNINN